MRHLLLFFLLFIGLSQCAPTESSIDSYLEDLPSIKGKSEYLASPFTTAGDQMYLVGHQDGTFPDLGWHVTGEMGGIWQHPIKLMDGFVISIENASGDSQCLDQAQAFINYPIAGQHQFELADFQLQIDRVQFVPNGLGAMMVELNIHNQASDQTFNGQLNFTGMVDLQPVWLGERTQMKDQKDEAEFDASLNAWVAKDQGNEWYCIFGSNEAGTEIEPDNCLPEHRGQGVDAASNFDLQIAPGDHQVLQFFISGSTNNKAEAVAKYQQIKTQWSTLLANKKEQYQTIEKTARLTVPDATIQQAFEWTKYASDWLRFEIPGQATGIAAGIPDYPWWFGCDQTYSARGLVTVGMADFATEIMEGLMSLSASNPSGQIVHEVSTNGAVYNPGNINETPHFIATAWELFCWTGDEDFLAKAYQQTQKGLTWLEAQDKNNNTYPDGHGMMEIHGMNAEMVDVIAYTYEAYEAAAQMAAHFEDQELAKRYAEKAALLKAKINSDWWVPNEASFADFRSDKTKAMELVKGAIVRADTLGKLWSVEDLKVAEATIEKSQSAGVEAYAFYHNWVVNTPLETGAADPEKALLALETGQKYINPFGVYVTGIDRKQVDNNPGAFASLKAKESFNYTGAVMTLPTGVQAISAARYGQSDQALDYLQRMVRSFSYAAPGSMYEVSPDYGMVVQAWNIYALARPIVSHFLGIQPEAYRKYIKIQPQLPSAWPEMKLEQLPIGGNIIDVVLQKNTYEITQTQDWEIEVVLPAGVTMVRVNGEEQTLEENSMTLTTKINKISW